MVCTVQFKIVWKIIPYSLLRKESRSLFFLVYVNDVISTGISVALIDQVKAFVHEKFQIKDLQVLKYFIGLEMARSPESIFITQHKYGNP